MNHHDPFSPGQERTRFIALTKPMLARPLAQARSWNQLHERLGELGLQLTRYDGPLMIGNGKVSVRFEEVSKVDLAHLEKRFGHWHAAIPLYHPQPGQWDDVVRLRRLGRGLAAKTIEATPEKVRELAEVVDRMGLATVGRVLPIAQLQAVRMALGVTRQTLSKILDPDLGRDR